MAIGSVVEEVAVVAMSSTLEAFPPYSADIFPESEEQPEAVSASSRQLEMVMGLVFAKEREAESALKRR